MTIEKNSFKNEKLPSILDRAAQRHGLQQSWSSRSEPAAVRSGPSILDLALKVPETALPVPQSSSICPAVRFRIPSLRRIKRFVVLPLLALLIPAWVFAQETPFLTNNVSGYLKSLNFFTRSTGLTPELASSPLALAEREESLFSTLERFRLKLRSTLNLNEKHRVKVKIDYDHQATFGSFVASGDFRLANNFTENRQFLDLSQTLVEKESAYYEHRLYRASVEYENDYFSLEVGRQQIPWGVGRFFTPTDLFNPFSPTQIELEERDGVDAVNFRTRRYKGYDLQFIYTPRGRSTMHPYRYLGRVTKDIEGYEIGLLGGRIWQDYVYGFDFQGNIGSTAVRGGFIYREARHEKDFIKFTVNADYNFPHNIYGLLEYHFNGQGRRNRKDYQLDRFLKGDIQQLAKNYLASMLGHNLTPLLRLEGRAIFNMDDQSFFLRPEIRYEWRPDVLFTLASQLYLGGAGEEFGRPENLYLGEMLYSF